MGCSLSCMREKARRPQILVEEGQTEEPVFDSNDVIIPDEIARPLLLSSNLMLITAIVAATYNVWSVCVSAIAVWLTSLLHWSAPRFSSWRRVLDYAAVGSMVVVGSWTAIRDAKSIGWTLVYFGGLALIGVIFVMNETLYYLQLQKTPAGGILSSSQVTAAAGKFACLAPTAPGTAARRFAYARAVWVHLLCIHVLASALAIVLITKGLNETSLGTIHD